MEMMIAFAVAVDNNDNVLAVGQLRNHDVPQDVPFDLVVVKLRAAMEQSCGGA